MFAFISNTIATTYITASIRREKTMIRHLPFRMKFLTVIMVLSVAGCSDDDSTSSAGQTVEPATPQALATEQAALMPRKATPASFTGSCEELASILTGLSETNITATSTVTAATLTVGDQAVAEHCLITGRMHERISSVDGQNYAISFELRMPKLWNGRFFHQGNGGIDGAVLTAVGASGGGALTHALQQGFAVLSSDAGHAGMRGPLFGLDPQARLDYGYQAVGALTPMAKEVIRLVYGKDPDTSYFGGCSNGGRHAFVAATRYADDYDGILAGAPGFRLPLAAIANIGGARQYARVATDPADLATAFTDAERALVASAVLTRCDALDGATDGLVQDTVSCQATFSLSTDVPTCAAGRDNTCLTTDQKSVIGTIFSGVTTASGAQVYSSFPYDGGIASRDYAVWEFTVPLRRDSGAVGFIFQVPPADPATFDPTGFVMTADLEKLLAEVQASDAAYTESALSFMMPPNPADLSQLKSHGGKMLVYHGVSDAIFSSDDTIRWYDSLAAANGGDASNLARVFLVPGMNHCSGGPATDQFDLLTPLVQWVEEGAAPDSIMATARGTGNPGGSNPELPADWAADRTRPLCAYPAVARYNGTGNLEVAASFTCQ